VTRGGPSFQPDTPLVRLKVKENFLGQVDSAVDDVFRKRDGDDDDIRCDASERESSLQTCRSMIHVNWELMVASGRMADIWIVLDEHQPQRVIGEALMVLTALANVAHWSKCEMHGAYFGAIGLLNPENHARLVGLLRLILEDDVRSEDWDLRDNIVELLGHATQYPPVAALAFGAFAKDMDVLAEAQRGDDSPFQAATIVGNFAQGPRPDRAEALTRAGCLQLLIDNFEGIDIPQDQSILACALASFSARAADCRAVLDVFLQRTNVERLVAIAELCRNEARKEVTACYDKRHWRRCARDVYVSVLADVRLAARLQPEGHSVAISEILAALLDTPEAAACVERHLAWREQRRHVWHNKMHMQNYDTGVPYGK
jgi:hypothetical protein